MSLIISPDKILIKDEDNIVKFDTDENIFFATDFISGQKTIPSRNVNLLQNFTHDLGACHTSATRAIGMFQVLISGTSDAGTPGFGWFNAGGTYLHFVDGRSGTRSYDHGSIARMSAYTFTCNGGELQLLESIQLANINVFTGDVLFTQKSFTINYRIWCGLFDQ